MREKLTRFEARGVHLACVVQGTAEEAARFCARHGIEEISIPDPAKRSYRSMGFPRCSWRDMIFASEELRKRRVEAREAGCRVSLSGALQKHSDVLQLPGAALFAEGGKILWLYRGAHTGDLPSADELVQVVEKLVVNY